MQIYSSPALGLDLPHSAGRARGEGRCLLVWVRPARFILKIDSHPLFFKRKHCHLRVTLIPTPLFHWATHGLTSRGSAVTHSSWLHWENDLLYHFAYVNECHIEAIKWSFSQLDQVSITVIVRDHTGHPDSPRRSERYTVPCYSFRLQHFSAPAQICLWWWQTCLGLRNVTQSVLCGGAWQESCSQRTY